MVAPTLELTQALAFTISSGQSLSDGLSTGNRIPIGLVMPAEWTNASITFQTSWDYVVWHDLYDQAGVEVAVQVAANRLVALQDVNFLPIGRYLRLRSGIGSGVVAQAAERVVTVRMARPITQ